MMRFIQIVLAAFVLSVATPALAQEWVESRARGCLRRQFPDPAGDWEIAYPSEYGVNLPARV